MLSDEEELNANEQGEHIVRRVVPVKDLHGILQGESCHELLRCGLWADNRLRQEGIRD